MISVKSGLYVYIKPPPTKKGTPWAYGKNLEQATYRSYEISTPTNKVRCNRIHIRPAALPNTPLHKPIIDTTHVPTLVTKRGPDHAPPNTPLHKPIIVNTHGNHGNQTWT